MGGGGDWGGGCYDITKTPAVDTTFLLPSVLPESDINPALSSLQMVAVECSAYEHGLPGLKPPSATDSVTLDHFYNLSVPQFPHGLWESGWTTEMGDS